MASSSFNPLYPTRIFIHGWNNNYTSPIPVEIKNAYIQRGNFNIVREQLFTFLSLVLRCFFQILVDWGALAMNVDYVAVQLSCGSVADEVANFLRFLVLNNFTSLSTLVMSGHSLGMHHNYVNGNENEKKFLKARTFLGSLESKSRTYTQSSVWTPQDLDTSRSHPPLGLVRPMRKKLEQYETFQRNINENFDFRTIVQVIHTTLTAGAWYPIGTCDFFVNNGLCQPGCTLCDPTCSHGRSGDYFAESINSFNFTVRGIYMGGEPLETGLSGIYNLTTNSQSPFAKG